MRRVLIHEDERSVRRDRDDVGVQYLRHGRAQGIFRGGFRLGSRHRSRGGRSGEIEGGAGAGWKSRSVGRNRHGLGYAHRGGWKPRQGQGTNTGARARLGPRQMERRAMPRQAWPGDIRPGRSGQNPAEGPDHQRPDRSRIAKPQLGLRRMHVHIQFLGRKFQPQGHHGMTAMRDDISIGDAHGCLQHGICDGPAIDHQSLRGAGHARHRGRAQIAAEDHFAPGGRPNLPHRQHRSRRFGPQERRHPGRPFLRREVEDHPAFVLQPKGRTRRGHRKAADDGFGVFGLGARVLQEFPSRRSGEKQVPHDDPCPRRSGGRDHRADHAALDRDRTGVSGAVARVRAAAT
jgi:hypothetical protein